MNQKTLEVLANLLDNDKNLPIEDKNEILEVCKTRTKTPEQSSMFIKLLIAQQGILFQDEQVLQIVYNAINIERNLTTLSPLEDMTAQYDELSKKIMDEANKQVPVS